MIKNITLLLVLAGLLAACNNETKETAVSSDSVETKIHEIGVLRLTLPAAYEPINAVQDLKKMFDSEAKNITDVDPGLFDVMVGEMGMNRRYYFDTQSDKNLNYIYFDEVGPRFPLTDQIIAQFISMYEQQNLSRYLERNYKQEKLDQRIINVWENRILKFRHKHTLDKMVWYTNYYLLFLKEDRRSLIVIEHDYNGGGLDLEQFITTIY